MNDKFVENEKNEQDGFVALTGEDGSVEKFYHIGTIDYKGEWYVFFQPAEPKNGIDPDELVVFRLSGDEKDETLRSLRRIYARKRRRCGIGIRNELFVRRLFHKTGNGRQRLRVLRSLRVVK